MMTEAKRYRDERDALLQRLQDVYQEHAQVLILLPDCLQEREVVKRIEWDSSPGPAVESVTVSASCDFLGACSVVSVCLRTDRPYREIVRELIHTIQGMQRGIVQDQLKIHRVTARGES